MKSSSETFKPLITPPIKNIREVTEPLKEQILKGDVHSIDEMRAWLKPFVYGDTKCWNSYQPSEIRHHTSQG